MADSEGIMDRVKLQAELIEDEGRRTHPYKDTRGIWTGGIGRNLEEHGASWSDIAGWQKAGIPDQVITGWYNNDVNAAVICCREIFPSYDSLPDNVQRTLVNMAFNLMHELKDWHGLQAAIALKDWTGAALSIMSSKFAHQAPNRCGRLAARMIQR
jgi:GH24 family phage-related lysozyme (muramidase)